MSICTVYTVVARERYLEPAPRPGLEASADETRTRKQRTRRAVASRGDHAQPEELGGYEHC